MCKRGAPAKSGAERCKLSRARELLGRRSKVQGARSNRVDGRQAWLCSQCAGNLIEESTCSWAVRSEVDQSESELADVLDMMRSNGGCGGDAGRHKVECRVESYKASPAAATTRACEVKAGGRRRRKN